MISLSQGCVLPIAPHSWNSADGPGGHCSCIWGWTGLHESWHSCLSSSLACWHSRLGLVEGWRCQTWQCEFVWIRQIASWVSFAAGITLMSLHHFWKSNMLLRCSMSRWRWWPETWDCRHGHCLRVGCEQSWSVDCVNHAWLQIDVGLWKCLKTLHLPMVVFLYYYLLIPESPHQTRPFSHTFYIRLLGIDFDWHLCFPKAQHSSSTQFDAHLRF